MAAIGGGNVESFDPNILLSLQRQIEKIPADKLSDYIINKTKKGDYCLEKLSWAEKKIRLLTGNKSGEKNIAEIVHLTIDGFNHNCNADYSKIVRAVSHLPGFRHVDAESKEIFTDLGELWIAEQEKLAIKGFLKLEAQFEAASNGIENLSNQPGLIKFEKKVAEIVNGLIPPSDLYGWENLSPYHKEQLQKKRDALVETIFTRLESDFPNYSLNTINKMVDLVENLDRRFGTSDSRGNLDSLRAESQKTVALLYSEVFDGVNSFLEKPWEKAVFLSAKIKDFQDFAGILSDVAETRTFRDKLKVQVAPLLESPLAPVPVSISSSGFTSSHPSDTTSFKEGEAMSGLVAAWKPLFPDFAAAVQTFGKGSCFDKVEVQINGEKVDIKPFLKKFEEQHPEIVAEKSATSGAWIAKTVFLCEQLFLAAKEKMPHVAEDVLKRAIAETLVTGAIDYNPIGLPTFIAPNLASFGVFEGHLLRPLEQKHQFSFSEVAGSVSSFSTTSQGYDFSNVGVFPPKTVSELEYTSKITKNFASPDADWTGTLESKKIQIPA